MADFIYRAHENAHAVSFAAMNGGQGSLPPVSDTVSLSVIH